MARNKSEKVPSHIRSYVALLEEISEHVPACERCNDECLMSVSCSVAGQLSSRLDALRRPPAGEDAVPEDIGFRRGWSYTLQRALRYVREYVPTGALR